MNIVNVLMSTSKFYCKHTRLGIGTFLDFKKANKIIFIENKKEEKCSIEESVMRIFKDFPIQIVYTYDESGNYVVIKGGQHISNLMKFIEEDLPIVIGEDTFTFSSFSEELKKMFLCRDSFFSTKIDVAKKDDVSFLNFDEFVEFLQNTL